MARTAPRTEKLDLRLTAATKRILQTAAAASSRSVSEFLIESGLARAAETLPDRARFGLDAEQWEAFQTALDAPAKPIAALKKLLAEPSVFEQSHAK
ncbi:type II toxin-antitoxin system TacA family antitoxin [Sphingomonas sp. YL-JM2C]